MEFNVYEEYAELIDMNSGSFGLVNTGWEDSGFQTEYELFYQEGNKKISVGFVKIGCRDQRPGETVVLPERFTRLQDRFFSLGQDEDYYDWIRNRVPGQREEILRALRDVAFDLELFTDNLNQHVMTDSLMRTISTFAVRNQFHRIAHGGVKLCEYDFSYTVFCDPTHKELGETCLEFHVIPGSDPPSNVHVLIGRNGTGKTTMIKEMIRAVRGIPTINGGTFLYESQKGKEETFANIICTAFSPFDDFSGLEDLNASPPCSYIGLKKNSNNLAKSIEDNFYKAFSNCIVSKQKRELWFEAIRILQEGDSTFAETNILQLINADGPRIVVSSAEKVRNVFSNLSSGHKVVLLTVTCCVDRIEERSILFLDEPENHLHPPLLAALIRALSNLLVKRNGVTIISTHSPVVLQEVPDNCVWKLYRKNNHLVARRPSIQTFGETIGALTKDVFGLDVMMSGFHKLLQDDVKLYGDYDMIYEHYDGKLGTEAKLLLRTMLLAQELGELE